MTTIRTAKKLPIPSLLLWALLGSGIAAGGCAYGGVAALPDGTVVVARNGMLGALRKIYVCKMAGTAMTCTETTNSP
jgi:hypothetical protein